MQDLLSELLWYNDDIAIKANQLCKKLPGFETAQRDYESAAQEVRDAVGYECFDRFQTCFLNYTSYEVQAYYALGLGLRETIVQALNL